MAHLIKTHDKQQGVKVAWHSLTEVKDKITLDDNWLTEWDLRPIPLEKHGKPSKWTILECSDQPDLEIGQPYNPATFKPIDNKAFLELVRDSIAGTEHRIVSVGSVRNRGRVFLSLELNGMEEFESAGRKFSAYLNYGNGHDKSSVLWANTSNTCTVCDNTFGMNLLSVENKKVTSDTDDISLSQRHCKNVIMKLPAMAQLIDKAIGVQAKFKHEFDRLGNFDSTFSKTQSLFAGFIGRNQPDTTKAMSTRATNTVDTLLNLFTKGRGNNGRTLADAFSAVTDYYTHASSGNGTNPNRQFLSSEYGSGQSNKVDFWNIVRNPEKLDDTIALGELLFTNK